MADDLVDRMVPRGTVERVRAELASEPPDPDLPWPPPPGWDFHGALLRIREEISQIEEALAHFTGDAIQRMSLESHRRRLEQRRRRWKRICFFSGWRPWHHRELAGD